MLYGIILCQIPYNLNMNKVLLLENFNSKNPKSYSLNTTNIILGYGQHIYYNNNLPNFENHNGLYAPKGFGAITSLFFHSIESSTS